MRKANNSRAYDSLSEFSEMLLGLAALFEVPVENEQFAKVLPEISYQISAIRQLEFVLKEMIFKGKEVLEVFSQVDMAVYHADYMLRDISRSPERKRNLEISREVSDVAIIIGKMAMEGYAKIDERGRRMTLGGACGPLLEPLIILRSYLLMDVGIGWFK